MLNAEKMTDFSLETMRHYSEIGLEQLRNVSSVDSPEAASDFSQNKPNYSTNLGKKCYQTPSDSGESSEIRNEVMTAMNEIYAKCQ